MAVIVAAAMAVFCESAIAGDGSRPPGHLIEPVQVVAAVLTVASLWWLHRKNVIRPGSFRGNRRDLSETSAIMLTIAAMSTFITQVLAMSIAATLVLGRDADPTGPMTVRQQAVITLSGTGAALVCAVAAMLLVGRGADRERSGLGLRPRAMDGVRGIVGLLLSAPVMLTASFLASVTFYLVTGRAPEVLAHDTLRVISAERSNPAIWGIIAAAVAAAPVVEELLFRGFIQSALLKATGRTWPSIIITSMLFAIAHFGGGVRPEEAQALLPLLVFGLCLGVAYERTRRLWVPITMHAMFNAANVAVTLGISSAPT